MGGFAPALVRDAAPASAAAQAGASPIAGPTDNGCFTDSSGQQAELWVRSELYFGTTKPGGTAMTDQEWMAFLDAEVTPRFPDGLTVLTGYGQFRGSDGKIGREQSKVLIILYPTDPSGASTRKLEEIRDAYEQQFNQQSVLRTEDSVGVCTSF